MPAIPNDPVLDSSLAFRREGYEFCRNRHRRFQSDIFSARLLASRHFCVAGEEAAEMFYTPDRFTRSGGLPSSTLKLLQDKDSVAVLDGDAHRQRKRMFLSLMRPERLELVASLAADTLRDIARSWPKNSPVCLHKELRGVFCKAACRWAEIPFDNAEQARLTVELGAMIDNAGSIGPANWLARVRRRRSEILLRDLVEAVRAGKYAPSADSALHVIASAVSHEGRPLAAETCAVELLNLLRPITAIATFVMFAALALHEQPGLRERLLADRSYLEPFVQEVRRLAPFFPIVAGVAREDFSWRDHEFHRGDRFVLDLYGTNRDARAWDEPAAFRPERFMRWNGSPFSMVPQGGGEFETGHRCAGEWLTIGAMKATIAVLLHEIEYSLPAQDLSVDLARIPARPESGVLIAVARVN